MKNNVVYCARYNEDKVAKQLGDCYILTSDNWDDWGYKTYFHVYIYKNGEQYKDFSTKILFKDENTSSTIFKSKLSLRTHDYITLKNIQEEYEFISLGNHYKELKTIFPNNFEEILEVLNDVIYLDKNKPDNHLLQLKESEGFKNSLCRDQSAKKVLEEAEYELYGGEELDVNRFQFDFNFKLSDRQYTYHFNFVNNDIPHRVNVLVGKNGSGKSQTLLALSKYFIDRENSIKEFNIEIDSEPNFIENTMVFAYTPYEDFPISKIKDYKYLGFRRYKTVKDIAIYDFLNISNGLEIFKCIHERYSLENINFSSMSDADIIIKEVLLNCHEFQQGDIQNVCMHINSQQNEIMFDSKNIFKNTFESFKIIYEKDRNNYAHDILLSDISYRNKIIEFLNNAFKCDGIGLKFINKNHQPYIDQGFEFIKDYIVLKSEVEHRQFVKDINFNDFESKLYFIKNDKVFYLSSGQQTFVDLVINLLSLIKINSLILIDEPENTLHPNLEIDFMRILKDILEEFDSFAIIATHSSIIVREVPSSCLHIIVSDEDNIEIQKPLIHTFGSNITDITNYIFDDIFENKPYTDWLLKELKNYDTFEEFQEKYQDILSYELMLEASNIKAKKDV